MPIYKTDKKKNGIYQYRVRINYTDSLGKTHSLTRTAYGAAEAKALEDKVTREIKEVGINAGITVAELNEEYLEIKKREKRLTTYDKARRNIALHIIPTLGAVKLTKLNVPMLQNWKNSISDKGLMQKTRKNIYGELRALLNFGVKMGYIDSNPLRRVGNFTDTDFTKPKDKLHYYTSEQFLKYIASAKDYAEQEGTLTAWGYYVFFAIAYYTGMRKGEINALKWSDIEGNIINVRRSVSLKIKGMTIYETPPKNKSSYRSLEAPVPLLEILEAHKARQKEIAQYSDDFRVCGGFNCLGDTRLTNVNIKFAEKAELPVIRIHDFRHSHASILANAGINIQEIARRLGHAKVEMTWNTYAHLYPCEEERAVAILNSVK